MSCVTSGYLGAVRAGGNCELNAMSLDSGAINMTDSDGDCWGLGWTSCFLGSSCISSYDFPCLFTYTLLNKWIDDFVVHSV